MKPIYKAACIQIEVTNYCDHVCPNCTRFIGHHKNPYFMDLEYIRKGIKSLDGFTGEIGLMGGETTLHPKFDEICKIYQEMIPQKERRGLWTDGLNWKKYEDIIRETFLFENIVYNDHNFKFKGYHQPLLIAADDIIDDKELMWELINKCWIQQRWSPSINPKGAFFCEVAAALDLLFNGPGGWPIEKGWWNKESEEFQDQVKRYCVMCSAAIPFDKKVYKSNFDFISRSNLEKLKLIDSPKLKNEKMQLYEKKYIRKDYQKNSKGWKPGIFRDFYQYEPGKRVYVKRDKDGHIIKKVVKELRPKRPKT